MWEGGEQTQKQGPGQTGQSRRSQQAPPPNTHRVCDDAWLQYVSRVSTANGITMCSLEVNLKKSDSVQKQDSYIVKLLVFFFLGLYKRE